MLSRVLDALRLDLKYSIRNLARSPAFVLVSVLSLAFGIAGATLLFGIINAAVFRPMPHTTDPHELVVLYTVDSLGAHGSWSYPAAADLREQAGALEDAAAVASRQLTLSTASGAAREIPGEIVSENYFDLLGVRMVHGRGFIADDAESEWRVAVIGYNMWQREFGGEPDVLGRALLIDGRDHTIVGVAPAGLPGHDSPIVLDLWVPLGQEARDRRGHWGFALFGRLRDGVGIEQARAQADLIAERFASDYPEAWRDSRGEPYRIAVRPERESRVPPDHRAQAIGVAAMLIAIVTLVLLVACSNVANLQLTRARRRRREIAMRLALGAARRRLVGQLVTESVLLAGLAGTLGLLVVHWLTLLVARGGWPISGPVALDFGVDGRVVAFSLLMTAISAIAFGVAPALQASRPDLMPALRGQEEGGRSRRFSLRNLLIIAQVAGSLVLVVGAMLLLRSLQHVRNTDLGFEPRNVAVLPLDLSQRQYGEETSRRFYADLSERLRALPGVEAVAMARTIPLGREHMFQPDAAPEGYEAAPGEQLQVRYDIVSPAYFDLVGIPFIRGRDFRPADAAGTPHVIIVNRAFAERFWPGEDPIGRRVSLEGDAAEVVGIVRNARYYDIADEAALHFWLPFGQSFSHAMTVHVRTSGDPRPLLPALREEVRAIDGLLPVVEADLMEIIVAGATLPQRIMSMVFGAAGAVGLGLAMLGIYGVMAYAVSQRTHEIGVRIALGAHPKNVVMMVVREGLGLSGVGLAVGLLLAAILAQLLRAVLFGVSPLDPVSLGGGLFLLALASVGASLPAALRAARVDPVKSLRAE